MVRNSTSRGLAAVSENEVYHTDIICCVNGGIDGCCSWNFSFFLPMVAFVFAYFILLRS